MNWATSLRREIGYRARHYAERHDIPYYLSLARTSPTVMFEPYAGNTLHGNFLSPSFREILHHKAWKSRLKRRHSQWRALPAEKGAQAKGLDSSNSSDALLMNVFCYPKLTERNAFARLFGQSELPQPEFGVRVRVPRNRGKGDRTEVDMRLGPILVEAKLTEPDFTSKSKEHMSTYRDFEEAFDQFALPQSDEEYFNYQLIRNVLAAFADDGVFFLICDARRPDLLRAWWYVMRAIKPLDLRSRCQFVLWQEIADAVPSQIREFMKEKYGIAATWDDAERGVGASQTDEMLQGTPASGSDR